MDQWNQFIQKCTNCRLCPLCNTRNKVVIGKGNNDHAKIMLIGEGPGAQEDLSGQAFVGQAGKLLDKLLFGIGFKQEDYYIANIVKCRPPENRNPSEDEAMRCLPWLRWQVSYIKPKIMVCLGSVASKYILQDKDIKISKARGIWVSKKGFDIMPTYHPAALLRNSKLKEPMWNDMKKVKKRLDEIKLKENT